MATDKKTTATKKAAPRKAAAKPAAKAATATKAKPAAKKVAKPVAKRQRQSKPLFAEVSLGKLKELLKDDDNAIVKVGYNYVLDTKKQQLEEAAKADLGI